MKNNKKFGIKDAVCRWGTSLRSGTLNFYSRHPLGFLACLALLLNFVIEVLSRRSLIDGIGYLCLHPYVFCFNALILLSTLSLSLLFPKRTFAVCLISAVWVILGITNCVMLGMRNSPLSAIDFGLLSSCFGIITVYLKIWQIVLIGVALLALICGLVLLYRKTARKKAVFLRGAAAVVSIAILLTATLTLSLRIGVLTMDFPDLPGAYDEYGFAYCFSLSVLDRGVRRPNDYSNEEIDKILSAIDTDNAAESEAGMDADQRPNPDVLPNIIVVQLESFFDVNRLSNITFTENPVPVFTALKESCPSGFLSVPSIGAGTANTEFEVLSGMSLDYFGAGEYPYKTILRTSTCESLAYNLKSFQYQTHAMHNNSGTFYDRNTIYPSLGFDTFTPLEYMQNVEYNPLGWAKDTVLTAEIMKALRTTDSPDLVFAVSVQPHGKYPDEEEGAEEQNAYSLEALFDSLFPNKEHEDAQENTVGGNLTGNVEGVISEGTEIRQWIASFASDDPKLYTQYAYYVQQIYETDAFLGALIAALSAYDEPVMLVAYGDHLPALEIPADALLDGSNLFQTEYVIWRNYAENEPSRKDLYAYQLSAEALALADMHEGLLVRLHQNYADDAGYQTALEMLEYDMLYGDMEAWNGSNPYPQTSMQLGTVPITVTGTYALGSGDVFYVTGENFTPFSHVLIDGRKQESLYIDASTLLVKGGLPVQGAVITVAQAGADRVILGESAPYVYKKTS